MFRRMGHWNGDGTGIGKGREIYAFIYEQLQQGRQKHIHVSASHQLHADAERDRDAVGVPLRLVHQARYAPDEPIQAECGVLFTTYTVMAPQLHGKTAPYAHGAAKSVATRRTRAIT